MKKIFNLLSALSLCFCFGVLFVLVLTQDPAGKIGALFFAFFGLLHYLFFDLSRSAKK